MCSRGDKLVQSHHGAKHEGKQPRSTGIRWPIFLGLSRLRRNIIHAQEVISWSSLIMDPRIEVPIKLKEPELDRYFFHDRAVRESGHDTSYRLEKVCANLATNDLNCLLYKDTEKKEKLESWVRFESIAWSTLVGRFSCLEHETESDPRHHLPYNQTRCPPSSLHVSETLV